MSVLPLRKLSPLPERRLRVVDPAPLPTHRDQARGLAQQLLADGVIDAHAVATIVTHPAAEDERLPQTLLSLGLASNPALTQSLASHAGLEVIDPLELPPDPALIDRLGAEACLRLGILPWGRRHGTTCVLVASPGQIKRRGDLLRAVFGRVRFALAPADRIEAALIRCRGDDLCRKAESLSPADESCRGMARPGRSLPLLGAALTGLGLVSPAALLTLFTLAALLAMVSTTALAAAALLAALRRPAAPVLPAAPVPLPQVSILVALYREADIAARLVQRLGRIDYPRDRLEILLVLEDDDHQTLAALLDTRLPPWMRLLTVPGGTLKTKPRALNYALPFCRGSIIGVYDAEDAPDPDQIRAVVRRFANCGPEVACLQGVLDFYNPARNWLSRAFTVEYAVWFRVVLPGLSRLGLPVPLGGTTLFFRRSALEDVGGWDAHNVTEDADLGIRLVRHGYRTDIIASVTREEANCRAWPWVRQRSRWIKGYMMTWRVHMRRPRLLWQTLGAKGFIAFNVLFLGSIAQAALFPALLLLWAVSLGFSHPLLNLLPPGGALALFGLGLLSEAVRIALAVTGLRAQGRKLPLLWAVLPHLVHPLACLAAGKALWEMIRRPFYWDKTQHGLCGDPAT
ncbi:MAG: glycosyltransferase [Rhodobacter sp.]|nr:glycosyltransferase [Rhodobacter sp.]MCA3460908.1 glycosyltransferase [Rhodobacter sp.]MCA3463931.1 glycosyltransferase [Rhodobacter sp.]MCA3467830.1 glycosyltransferase [Rhodobacter sp.]MCA3471417.1 glycosyltransferase [Rhodobacter sp.]